MTRGQHLHPWLLTAFRQLEALRPSLVKGFSTLWQSLVWCYWLIWQVVQQAIDNQTAASASVMAYNAMLSLFPALLLILGLIRRLASPDFVTNFVERILPEVAPEAVVTLVREVTGKQEPFGGDQLFSFGVIALLWLASAFLTPVIRALNNSYQVPLHLRRPWWFNRLFAIAIFIGTVVLVLMASILAVAVPIVINSGVLIGINSEQLSGAWELLSLSLAVGLIVLALGFIYRVAPAQQPEFAPVWPGAIAGGTIWLVVSFLFRFYVVTFGRYKVIYGSIGAAIVMLLWLYLSSFGILLGGEVNAAIHQLRIRHRARLAAQTLTANSSNGSASNGSAPDDSAPDRLSDTSSGNPPKPSPPLPPPRPQPPSNS